MEEKEQLPAFVLAELYNKLLVFTDDVPPQQPLKTENNYLGNYEKKIIVLVNDENNIYLNDVHLNFLSDILNACKLNLAHIALINFNNSAVNFHQLKKQLQPEFLLSFGITALQMELPFTIPDYQVQQYNNCNIVIAPALIELNKLTQQAKTEKAKLWKSLQKMFSLEK